MATSCECNVCPHHQQIIGSQHHSTLSRVDGCKKNMSPQWNGREVSKVDVDFDSNDLKHGCHEMEYTIRLFAQPVFAQQVGDL